MTRRVLRRALGFTVLGIALCLFAASTRAAERVAIELNKLEPQGDACRAYLVLKNGTTSAFETLKLDLVMFDADSVVARRLAVETALLPAGKTSLKVFATSTASPVTGSAASCSTTSWPVPAARARATTASHSSRCARATARNSSNNPIPKFPCLDAVFR